MGSQARKGLHNPNKSPGPGTYNYDDKVSKEIIYILQKYGPKYVMGTKSAADFKYLIANPGPGTYLSSNNLL